MRFASNKIFTFSSPIHLYLRMDHVDDFASLRVSGNLYVDKSNFIEQFMRDPCVT
jgi:hypothetical protein